MKKRIIISNYDDICNPYYGGGGSVAIHETAARLSRTFHVSVITGKYPHAKEKTIGGVHYLRTGISFGGPKFGQLVFQAMLLYQVRTKKYDLWLESFTPPFSTGLLQLFTQKPVVGLVHMLCGEDMKRKYTLPFDTFEKLGLKTYRHFITTSKYIKNKISKENRNASIIVIPNGVKAVRTIKETKKKKYILYLGRIEIDQKGIDLLLQAYKLIEESTLMKLAIAGSGEKAQVKRMQSLIMKLNLEKSVIYFGRVGEKGKARLMSESACLVVPSRFETFSMVSLEGLVAGLPIVSFAIPGLAWLPKDAGVKVTCFHIKKFSQAILRSAARKQRLINTKQFVKTHSWEAISKQYEQYISAILD